MPAFAMRKIVKRFPGVVANRDVDFTIEAGEIHALLGENGAGKSTLMQILYGFHSMDSGSILIDDKPVAIASPKDAIALGIGMVHQEFMLVTAILRCRKRRARPEAKVRPARSRDRLRSLSEQHHLAIDPHAQGAAFAHWRATASRDPQAALSRRQAADPRRTHRRAHHP